MRFAYKADVGRRFIAGRSLKRHLAETANWLTYGLRLLSQSLMPGSLAHGLLFVQIPTGILRS